jgi:carboxyl-terminal processing protease
VSNPSSPSTTFAPGIPNAEDYLLEAISFVESNALFAEEIDWDERRLMAQDEVATARHPFHLHEFIRAMLVDLNDNHSHLVSLNTAADLTDGSHPVNASVELIADRIGRVRVGAFSDTVEHSDEYVAVLHSGISAMSRSGVCGWIVDLRSNTGGNMWPMIVGIGPLLEPINQLPTDRHAAWNPGLLPLRRWHD